VFGGALVLVDAAQGVAELVDDDALVLLIVSVVFQPSVVHGGLVLWEEAGDETVLAYGRP
jgi:hypothetical protein